MDSESVGSAAAATARTSDMQSTVPANAASNDPSSDASAQQSTSGLTSWARNLKIPLPSAGSQDESSPVNSAKATFARFTTGIASRLSPREQTLEQGADPASPQSNFFGNLTKGLVDSSKSAVRAVQVKARHVVSQNKRRYQVT